MNFSGKIGGVTMDKIREKLVELDENLTAIEVCLLNGSLGYTELILFLQYDEPLEEKSEMYVKMKEVFGDKLDRLNRCSTDERAEALKAILSRLKGFVAANNTSENQPQEDYSKAISIAEKICDLLDAQKTPTNETVPYPKKAAL